MTVVSNGQFWMYTLTLIVVWIIVLTTASANGSKRKNNNILDPTNDEDERKNTGICKNLCQQCGCLGFYCGEECICECNDDNADTECIRKIQINAQSLNIPFEILIQGPTANNFVRKALLYEQNQERKLYGYRSKRPTVTVYKPTKGSQNMQKPRLVGKNSGKKFLNGTENSKNRHKRSSNNNHFEWFSNLGTSLLRPAPLNGRKRQVEETQKPVTKGTTVSSIFDNSWIFDSTRNILTPRPLKKRKLPPKTSVENNMESSVELESPSSHNNDPLNDEIIEARKFDYDFNEEPTDKKIEEKQFHSREEPDSEVSRESIIGNLYSRLFKKNFKKVDNKSSFLPEEKHPEESFDYLSGSPQSSFNNDPLSPIDDDKTDLFSEEEVEEDRKPAEEKQHKEDDSKPLSLFHKDSPLTQKSSPLNIQKGLEKFGLPWLKPGKLLEKFKNVIVT